MREELFEILNDYTGGKIENIGPDFVLTADLGLNSVELLDLVCIIEEKYNIMIPDRMLQTLVTVKDVVEYLEKTVKA
ncbi:MAG: acyl carrier protein [Clostridiales bacterium]|jgi:acyl carrier protein|nr:acyl carrier protein [Clostridiales bacterium]